MRSKATSQSQDIESPASGTLRIIAEVGAVYEVGARVGGNRMSGVAVPAWPEIDFAEFGEVEVQPLSRIKGLPRATCRATG
jgi:hypothetical protein